MSGCWDRIFAVSYTHLDVYKRQVCHDVLRHRIGLSYEAEANNLTSEDIISEILNTVEVP